MQERLLEEHQLWPILMANKGSTPLNEVVARNGTKGGHHLH